MNKKPDHLDTDIKLLQKYDDAYHNGTAIIPDYEYDKFKDALLKELPPNHPLFSKVGHTPSSGWPKTKLTIFMGSLDKLVKEEEHQPWIDKITKLIGIGTTSFVGEAKVDGFSLEARYQFGVLTHVISRGDGTIGENITKNGKHFKGMPLEITELKEIPYVYFRGEGHITKSDYELLKKESGEDHYKNPRNAASGISRRYDGKQSQYISVVFYDVLVPGLESEFVYEQDKLNYIRLCGLGIPHTMVFNSNEMTKKFNEMKKIRDKMEYEIDGFVVKINGLGIQDNLGVKDNKPISQIALKFDAAEGISIVRGIIGQVGKTGCIVPVAEIDPVDIMGSTISRVGLSNYGLIHEKDIGIGSKVVIEKCGDIIPQVSSVIENNGEYNIPKSCPECGKPATFDGVNLWCTNQECKAIVIGKLIHWAENIGIKGFSDSFFTMIYEKLGVRTPDNIYSINERDLGYEIGDKMLAKFNSEITKTCKMTPQTFLAGLSIKNLSTSRAELLLNKFGSVENILKLDKNSLNDITSIPGMGDIYATQIIDGISESKEMAFRLLNSVILIKSTGKLVGLSFCVTGALESMQRKEFTVKVTENGGSYKSSVSKGLTHLVTNDKESGSAKNRDAQEKGVKLINDPDFLEMIN